MNFKLIIYVLILATGISGVYMYVYYSRGSKSVVENKSGHVTHHGLQEKRPANNPNSFGEKQKTTKKVYKEVINREEINNDINHPGLHYPEKIENDHNIGVKAKPVFDFIGNDHVELVKPTNPEFAIFGEAVAINSGYLRTLKVGQSVIFPMGDGKTLNVIDVEKRSGQRVRLKMSIEGLPNVYRAVFTVGEQVMYGRIITPEAGYEIEAVNGKGWIVDTRKIDKKMPEDGVDYLVPEY